MTALLSESHESAVLGTWSHSAIVMQSVETPVEHGRTMEASWLSPRFQSHSCPIQQLIARREHGPAPPKKPWAVTTWTRQQLSCQGICLCLVHRTLPCTERHTMRKTVSFMMCRFGSHEIRLGEKHTTGVDIYPRSTGCTLSTPLQGARGQAARPERVRCSSRAKPQGDRTHLEYVEELEAGKQLLAQTATLYVFRGGQWA